MRKAVLIAMVGVAVVAIFLGIEIVTAVEAAAQTRPDFASIGR